MTTVADTENPNIQTGKNSLNHVGFTKVWNGIPMKFGKRIWLMPFNNALGNVSVDGATLYECAQRISPGGTKGAIIKTGLPLGTYKGAPQVHANDAQTRQELTRQRRLFNVILAHILQGTDHYDTLTEEFDGFGPNAYEYLEHHIELELKPEEIAKMQTYWSMMTVEKLGLAFDGRTMMAYYQIIHARAKEFDPEMS